MSRVAEAISRLVCDSINKTRNLYLKRETLNDVEPEILVFIAVHSPATFLSNFWCARRESSLSRIDFGVSGWVRFSSKCMKLVRQLTLHRSKRQYRFFYARPSATSGGRRQFAFLSLASSCPLLFAQSERIVLWENSFYCRFICQCKKNCECLKSLKVIFELRLSRYWDVFPSKSVRGAASIINEI